MRIVLPCPKLIITLVFIIIFGIPAASLAESGDEYTPWMDAQAYQKVFDQEVSKGNYPKEIVGKCLGKPLFRAKFVSCPADMSAFYCHHSITTRWFNQRNKELSDQGYKLIFHQQFSCKGREYHQATWVFRE